MIIFMGSVLLLLGFIYWMIVFTITKQHDEAIEKEANWLLAFYESEGLSRLLDIIDERSSPSLGINQLYAVVLNNGEFLSGNIPKKKVPDPWIHGWVQIEFDPGLPTGSNVAARVKVVLLGTEGYLVIGWDTRQLTSLHELIAPIIGWGLLLMFILSIIGGLMMGRAVLWHIEQINRIINEILNGNMNRRVPVGGSQDEFDQLAINLNSMLDEIKKSIENTRLVSSNIAHELRTPLTRLQNQIQILYENLDSNGQPTEDAARCLDYINGLLQTFSALLRIARIEAGAHKACFKSVDVQQLLIDCKELYEMLAEEKGVFIKIIDNPEISLLADRDLLFQSVANLIDNAVRFSNPGGCIELAAFRDGDYVVISVKDNGPGIVGSEKSQVVLPFYRGRGQAGDGHGLGLSLVEAVAKMHNGSLELKDNRPGLMACIRLSDGGRGSCHL